MHTQGPKGELILDDNFYVIFNAYYEALDFKLPPKKYADQWTKIMDTSQPTITEDETTIYKANQKINVPGRFIILLHHPLV